MIVICGLDEAGRGPLAGPVTAGCVVLGTSFDREGLNDSKKLTASKRRILAERIRTSALAWGLGWSTAAEVDRDNVLRASLTAMTRAWEDMRARFPAVIPDQAIVDGLFVPLLPISGKARPLQYWPRWPATPKWTGCTAFTRSMALTTTADTRPSTTAATWVSSDLAPSTDSAFRG